MSTPRIVLSMTALQGEHAPERGIARYVAETTRALLRAGAPVAALGLSPHRPVPDHFPADLRDSGLLRWATQPLLSGLRREGPVVLHVFSPFELVPPVDAPFLPAAAQPGAATTATFYDAIPLRHPGQYLDLPLARVRYDAAAAHLRAVERVFAISDHAAREAVDAMGVDAHRVVAVGAGASETFVPSRLEGDPWPTLRDAVPGLREGFVLTVGGSDERKNVRRLVEALPHLPDDVQLVQVGRTDPKAREEWHRVAAAAGGPGRLLTLDVVTDAVLRRLYQACAAFVFVSLEEGFGLPVLEAARSGAVIVTSDRTSVPEVLDEPSTTVDPLDPAAIARAVRRALHDDSYRSAALAAAERAVARHTWEAVAQRMMAEWAALPLQPTSRWRARMGLVAHIAGDGADGGPEGRANLALAAALAERADVTVFAADAAALASVGDPPCTVLPLAALGTTVSPHTFDNVVHVVGDDPTPGAAAALWRWPGVAMVSPAGAGAALGMVAALPGHAAGWVEGEFDVTGERLAPAWRDARTAGAKDLPAGVPLGSAALLGRCATVVASSARDAALLRLDLATRGAVPPVEVVPPVVVAAARPAAPDGATILVLGAAEDRLWLLLHLTTGLGRNVQVFQQDTAPDPAPPWGVTSRAATTGVTFDRAWQASLRQAVVVLDLGAPWGRAAAIEAIGHGVPVVTTGAWAGGSPAGVVRRLDSDCSDLALLGHVLALAAPSPLRRHQHATAARWVGQSSPAAVAEQLSNLLDGRPGTHTAPPPEEVPAPWLTPPRSAVCRAEDLRRAEHLAWCGRLGEAPRASRKLWEYTAISTTLAGLGLLAPGRRGLGFGVGREPLVAAYAAAGVHITATDLAADRPEAQAWSATGQLASPLADLNDRLLCPPDRFDERVTFRPVDMTAIPEDLAGFDFCWSSCALEHLGSLAAGLDFVEASLRCVRPGGWAVHTTELVLSSDDDTIDEGATVLYRERDLRDLVQRLQHSGHRVAPLDLTLGDLLEDHAVDLPPYAAEPHLKLLLGSHITTSVLLAVQRAGG